MISPDKKARLSTIKEHSNVLEESSPMKQIENSVERRKEDMSLLQTPPQDRTKHSTNTANDT